MTSGGNNLRTDSISDQSIYSALAADSFPHLEPIILQGNGRFTIFGVNNRFNPVIPKRLLSKVAPEEYEHTIRRVNRTLRSNFTCNIFWFLCGCMCFCCTLGLSMGPAVYSVKRTLSSLDGLLKRENLRLYNHLGLHWSVHKQHMSSDDLLEYVLMIDFLQKPVVYAPD